LGSRLTFDAIFCSSSMIELQNQQQTPNRFANSVINSQNIEESPRNPESDLNI